MSRFARRHPAGHPDASAAPVTLQAWVVVGALVAGLFLSAVAFAAVGIIFGMLWGVLAFLIVAGAAGALFVMVAGRMGNQPTGIEDVRNALDH